MDGDTCLCGCGRTPKPGCRYLRSHAGHASIRAAHPWGPRLWDVVDTGYTSPCHIWRGSKNKWGYGRTRWKNRTWQAHIRSWLEAGRAREEGKQFDHLCRQRACVNVDHLELVTPTENTRRGTATKLTAAQVAEIRARYTGAYGEQSALAREYGVVPGNIRWILSGATWGA